MADTINGNTLVTAGELAQFLNDRTVWADRIYMDENDEDEYEKLFIIAQSGYTARDPQVTVKLKYVNAVICDSGNGQPLATGANTLTKLFAQWKEKQDMDIFVIRVPKSQRGNLVAKLKELSATIVQ